MVYITHDEKSVSLVDTGWQTSIVLVEFQEVFESDTGWIDILI